MNTHQTSAQAFSSLGNMALKTEADKILDIVLAAQRLLLDCLNDDRPANLTPEAMLLLLRMAHQKGFHGGMGYVCERLGYAPPVAITPVDEVADLQRKFIEAQQAMARMVAQMQAASERIVQPVGALRAVRS